MQCSADAMVRVQQLSTPHLAGQQHSLVKGGAMQHTCVVFVSGTCLHCNPTYGLIKTSGLVV
jgi:hypothetical protein